MATELVVKRIGNSLGVILPSELVKDRKIREKQKILVEIVKETDLSEVFGTLKRRMSGQDFKNFARDGW